MKPETVRARNTLYAAIRSFFAEKNYLEVETPLLAPALIPESAIEVFASRYENPYREGRDVYLIPSPELWMKRLIAAGYGNIFQICKAFRNAESLGRLHNPEFSILEYYTTGTDYMGALKLTEDLFAGLVKACREKLPGLIPEDALTRLAPPFCRLTMAQAFKEYAGLDLEGAAPIDSRDSKEAAVQLRARARERGLPFREGDNWEEAFNRIFAGVVEPALPKDKPLALMDYPRGVRCLARDISGTPWNERWELYVNGMEIANCFTEETGAEKTAAFFREETQKKKNALVRHAIDEKLPRLCGSLPACSGAALGLDRLVMAFCGESSIGGVILFPFSDIILT